MRARVLVAGGFLAGLTAIAASGCAVGGGGLASAPTASGPAASTAGCATSAYRAIRAHERLTRVPTACQALTPSQRNVAAGLAIRMASGTGSKSRWRSQAGTAAAYVSTLITDPPPIAPAPAAGSASVGVLTASGGSRLGFSELAAEVAALLAWLATAGSGGWILIRWWRAGGRPARLRGRTDAAAPSAVILGHVGLGLFGLAVWVLFMITGWAAFAWISVGVLGPVAGLGMTVLISGMPSPRSPATPAPAGAAPAEGVRAEGVPAGAVPAVPPAGHPQQRLGTAVAVAEPTAAATSSAASSATSPTRSGGYPVAAIAAHGLFVLATLLLVLLAAIGA
jgi:hypothetical protein